MPADLRRSYSGPGLPLTVLKKATHGWSHVEISSGQVDVHFPVVGVGPVAVSSPGVPLGVSGGRREGSVIGVHLQSLEITRCCKCRIRKGTRGQNEVILNKEARADSPSIGSVKLLGSFW